MKEIVPILIYFLILGASGAPSSVRIVGGKEATAGQFSWQAIIRHNGLLICGGSILNEQWLLTAAHCLNNRLSSNLEVIVGTLNSNGRNGMFHNVSRTVLHEEYHSIQNDIGLIQTTESILFSANVGSIKLAEVRPRDGSSIVASGFGKSSASGEVWPIYLQYFETFVMSSEECKSTIGLDYPGLMCLFREYYKQGICNGDDGGPAVSYNVNNEPELVGVAIFAYTNCANGFPDGFTSVPYYKIWIEENILKSAK